MKYNASTSVYSITGTHLIPSFFLSVLKLPQYTVRFTIYTYIQIKLAEIYLSQWFLILKYKSLILKQTNGEKMTPPQVP